MVAPLLACMAFQAQPLTASLRGAALLNHMFTRFSRAERVEAVVDSVVGDGRGTLQFTTEVKSLPGSIFHALQTGRASTGKSYRFEIISDGTAFRYTPPEYVQERDPGLKMIVEQVNRAGVVATNGEIYQVGRSGLGMRPFFLDALFSTTHSLLDLFHLFATVEDLGTQELDGEALVKVGGAYRELSQIEPTGRWEMLITPDGLPRLYSVQIGVDPSMASFSIWIPPKEEDRQKINLKPVRVVLPANAQLIIQERMVKLNLVEPKPSPENRP